MSNLPSFETFGRRVAHSLVRWMKQRPAIDKRMSALADWYADKMGHRKYGLIKDDLIDDEHPVVKEAIKRLSDQDQFDRMFRLRRAIQVHINKDILPRDQWTLPENDKHYLLDHIWAICREQDEKNVFDKLKPMDFETLAATKKDNILKKDH